MKPIRVWIYPLNPASYALLIPVFPGSPTIPNLWYWNQTTDLLPDRSKRQYEHDHISSFHLVPDSRTNLRMRKRKNWVS